MWWETKTEIINLGLMISYRSRIIAVIFFLPSFLFLSFFFVFPSFFIFSVILLFIFSFSSHLLMTFRKEYNKLWSEITQPWSENKKRIHFTRQNVWILQDIFIFPLHISTIWLLAYFFGRQNCMDFIIGFPCLWLLVRLGQCGVPAGDCGAGDEWGPVSFLVCIGSSSNPLF